MEVDSEGHLKKESGGEKEKGSILDPGNSLSIVDIVTFGNKKAAERDPTLSQSGIGSGKITNN